jgi:hypothetical protein
VRLFCFELGGVLESYSSKETEGTALDVGRYPRILSLGDELGAFFLGRPLPLPVPDDGVLFYPAGVFDVLPLPLEESLLSLGVGVNFELNALLS